MDSRNGGLAPEVGCVGIIRGSGGRVQGALFLDIEDLGFVFLGVDLGRRRGPEPRDVAESRKRRDKSGLRCVRQGVGTGSWLVDARFLGAVGEVNEICELVIRAGLSHPGCCCPADSGGLLAFCRVGIESNDRNDGAQGRINSIVQTSSVEDPEYGVVGGVRDRQLLELDVFIPGFDCRLIDSCLHDGLVPCRGGRRQTPYHRPVDEGRRLVHPVAISMELQQLWTEGRLPVVNNVP